MTIIIGLSESLISPVIVRSYCTILAHQNSRRKYPSEGISVSVRIKLHVNIENDFQRI
jgi:hypothetical protein